MKYFEAVGMKRFTVHDMNFLGVISIAGIYIGFYIPKAEVGGGGRLKPQIFLGQRSHFPPTSVEGTRTGPENVAACKGLGAALGPAAFPRPITRHSDFSPCFTVSIGNVFMKFPRE